GPATTVFPAAGAPGTPGRPGGGGGLGTLPTPPGLKATMNPSGRPEMPTAAYTVLRAMATPPQLATGLVPVDEPRAIGLCRIGVPMRLSKASRKPLRSTVYVMPLPTAT